MPNYSLNNSVPEPDRSLDDPGFNNVYPETNSRMPTVPYHKSAPLADAAVPTSNTQKIQIGPSAHDLGGK